MNEALRTRNGALEWIGARRDLAYRSAWRILRDDADAEDAAQEALVAAVRARDALAGAADPERYLRRMAVNAALVLLRSERSRRARERRMAVREDATRADDRVESAEERRAVAAAVARLPEELRVPVVLRYAEDLTLAEIGEALGVSGPAIHGRLRRAEDELRALLRGAGAAGLAGVGALEALLGDLDAPAPSVAASARLARATSGGAAPVKVAAAVLVPVVTLAIAAGVLLPRYGPWRDGPGRGGSGPAGGALAAGAPEEPDEGPGAPGAAPSGDRITTDDGSGGGGAPEPAPAPADPPPSRPPPPPPAGRAEPAAPTRTALLSPAFIEGLALDFRGGPVPGAEVLAVSAAPGRHKGDSLFEPTTRAGRDGYFRLELPVERADGERYALIVRIFEGSVGGDYGVFRRDGIVARPGERAEVPDVDAPGGVARCVIPWVDTRGSYVLSGVVLDAERRPLPGALVEVRWITADGAQAREEATAVCDARGRFRIDGKRVGKKELRVAPPPGAAAMPLEERIDVADGATVERELVLPGGGAIGGHVVDLSGAPLARFPVVLRPEGRMYPGHHVNTDERGAFRIGGLVAGRYELAGAGAGPSGASFFRSGLTPGSTELRLVARRPGDPEDAGDHGAELHGEVVDAATGEPVPIERWVVSPFGSFSDVPGGAAVKRFMAVDVVEAVRVEDGADILADLVPQMYFDPYSRQVMVSTVELPEPPVPEPTYAVRGLSAGRYLLFAVVPSAARGRGLVPGLAGPFTLKDGEIRRGIRVTLERAGIVTGLVADAATRSPLAGAEVLVIGTGPGADKVAGSLAREVAETGGRLRGFSFQGKSGPDGRYRLADIPPGVPLRLAVVHGDRPPAVTAPFTIRAGGATIELDVALEAKR